MIAHYVVTADCVKARLKLAAKLTRKLRDFCLCSRVLAVIEGKDLSERHHSTGDRPTYLAAAQSTTEAGGYSECCFLVKPGIFPGGSENGLSAVIAPSKKLNCLFCNIHSFIYSS